MCFVKRRGQLSPRMTEQKAGAGSVSPAADMFGRVCELSGLVDTCGVLPQLIDILSADHYSGLLRYSGLFRLFVATLHNFLAQMYQRL